ncbi:bifunctional diguanylate cyclase/phosphodiesterase [Paenibacillus silvisoli]|uniref:bifunctional diguanylate cyclase/phosphodiesterase n=1 Tax=Paenibacillus silvisoli TaxID=3110539 RepID=UPI0028047D92|nr:diguanylate cyclase [Paenibacillus silvisoli]
MQGQFNGWIVFLSFIIAVMASYSALNLAGKITRSQGRTRTVWLFAGSLVMGIGVWSMHFVGMLAYHFDASVSYDATTTILSSLGSISASFIAFRLTSRSQFSAWRYALGGFTMGCGIVAMHYTGMYAINTSASITYDPVIWSLSAGIALAASYAALFLFHRLRHSPDFSVWKLICAIVMGIAICGMHYTGMAAATFTYAADMHHAAGSEQTQFFLLFGVTVSTFFILIISWGAIFFDRHVLEKMAYTDHLTHLPNRHELQRFFDLQQDKLTSGALLFIDLDRFKIINDTLGHDIGDLLLMDVAERLRASIGSGDVLFRLGGDEFLIITATMDEAVLKQLAKRVLEEVKRAYFIDVNELYVTCSVGISLAPQHGVSRSALLKAADTAMYAAKADGKNRYRFFDDELSRSQVRKLVLEKDMQKAMIHGEFRVMYQPKWDSATNQLVGMEALMRWEHPQLGQVSPGEFIAIAEETGMIIPMSRWMLKEVCRQNMLWRESGAMDVCISVNMSVRVFENQMLHDMVLDALQGSGLPGSHLELEITESIAMSDVKDVKLRSCSRRAATSCRASIMESR